MRLMVKNPTLFTIGNNMQYINLYIEPEFYKNLPIFSTAESGIQVNPPAI